MTDVHVAPPPTGNDTTGDGSQASPWATVDKGVGMAATVVGNGITARVHVQTGTYDEDIVMVDGVSILGGYAADWSRDPSLTPTTLRANNPGGTRYAAGGAYSLPTELDGLVLALDPTDIVAPDLATVTVEEGTASIRDSTVQLATAAELSVGLLVAPGAGSAASLDLDNVRVEGGDVTAPDGVVVGVALYGAGGSKQLSAAGLVVDHPMPQKRRHYGVDLDGGAATLASSTVSIAAPTMGAAVPLDEVCGVRARNGAALELTSATIDPGGGFTRASGICASAASTLMLTGSQVAGGAADGASGAAVVSSAVFLSTDVVAAIDSSMLVGGSVPAASAPGLHYSIGLEADTRARVTVTGGTIDAGPGDTGVGVRLVDPASVTVTGAKINTANGGAACTSARSCIGVWVDGRDGPVVTSWTPQVDPFSCCDAGVYGVVLEGSEVVGGNGTESVGVLVTTNPGQRPGLCANATAFDAGDCPSGSSTCKGLDVRTSADVRVHNAIIYGGTGPDTTGARIFAGSGTLQLANSYVHGGDARVGVPNTVSTGVFLVNGNATQGPRVINNIIDGGAGATRYGAFEENHNADPFRFQANNLVFMGTGGSTKSVLYRNCTPVSCAFELNTIALVNTQLTGSGQTTVGQGSCITSSSCLVDPAPRGGDVRQAVGSTCVNAGLEQNQSCNICQTPWSDAFGAHRLVKGWTAEPAPCTQNGPDMSGDGLPDIGPAED